MTSAPSGSVDSGPSRDNEKPALLSVLESVSTIVAPITLIAALAFYIGLVRQQELAIYLGLQAGLLGLSYQDYLFRSTATLVPFVAGLSTFLLVLAVLALLARELLSARSKPLRRLGASVAFGIGLLLMVFGMWRLFTGGAVTGAWYLVGPIALFTGCALLLAYGSALLHDEGLGGVTSNRFASIAYTTPLVALMLVSVFWAANDYARRQGYSAGRSIERTVDATLPAVTIYSPDRLVFQSSQVRETFVGTGQEQSDRYRYEGFRLLLRGGENYFLMPNDWSRHRDAVVMLPHDSVRLEFRPGGGQ